MAVRVRLDSQGLTAVAKSPGVTTFVAAATEAVAENVRGMNIDVEGVPGDIALPVTTMMVVTDRAHGIVALAHPSGESVQAKHGALTKAAAQAGLEVTSR